MAFHECSDGPIGVDGPRRMKQFLRHAQFRLPRKKRRKSGGQDFGGDHEHQAVGHFHELSLGQNVSLAIGVVGANELIAESKSATKIGRPRLFGDE